jgi:hypothetical protein
MNMVAVALSGTAVMDTWLVVCGSKHPDAPPHSDRSVVTE